MFRDWLLNLEKNLVQVKARVLPNEHILLGGNQS